MTGYVFSTGFMEDICRLAELCDQHGTDNVEVTFPGRDGFKAVVELTFKAVKDGKNEA